MDTATIFAIVTTAIALLIGTRIFPLQAMKKQAKPVDLRTRTQRKRSRR